MDMNAIQHNHFSTPTKQYLIEKRMRIVSAVNKGAWETVFTGSKKTVLSRASNFLSLSIKIKGVNGVWEEAQQSKTSNSKNTLAECSKESLALGNNKNETKHFASSRAVLWVLDAQHMSTGAPLPSSMPFLRVRPPT